MIRRRPHLDDCPRAPVRDLLAETSISLHSACLYFPLVNTGEPINTFHVGKQQKTVRFSRNLKETASSGIAV